MVDSELLLTSGLRSDGIARVYVDQIPDSPVWPLVRLTLLNASPSNTSTAAWLQRDWFQIDVYGGTKAQAQALKEHVVTSLRNLPGVHTEGVVTAVQINSVRSLPDVGYQPPRSRYVISVSVSVHP